MFATDTFPKRRAGHDNPMNISGGNSQTFKRLYVHNQCLYADDVRRKSLGYLLGRESKYA